MQAEYDVTPDDLVAFGLCHHSQSQTVRKQSWVSVLVGLMVLLFLPGLILLVSDKPILEIAPAIWPLLMGPILFLFFFYLLVKFRGSRFYREVLSERQSKFLDRRTLSLEDDALRESMASGTNQRSWSSVDRILLTNDHAFVYTSAVEAFILPKESFSSTVSFDEFLQEIAQRAKVKIQKV